MREIKFRGSWFDNEFKKHWAYGNLTILTEQLDHVEAGYYISNRAGSPFAYKVDSESVGEFTGLKSKSGVEIYEGDILNSLYANDGCKGLYEIVWHDGAFKPKKHKKHQQVYVTITNSDLERCEVIGNVWENKELLNENLA